MAGRLDALVRGESEIDEAHRLLRRAAVGTRDARARDRQIGAEARPGARGHRLRRLGAHRPVALERGRLHAEQRLLGAVRVRDHAAQEVTRRAGRGGERRADHAGRERLGGREREPARGQLGPDDLGHRLAVAPVGGIADDLPHPAFHAVERLRHPDRVGRERRERQIEAVGVRQVGDAHVGLRRLGREKLGRDGRFGEADGADHAARDHRGGVRRAEVREHVGGQHRLGFRGHARKGEEVGPLVLEMEPRRGAARVLDDARSARHQRLRLVHRRHLASPLLEPRANLGEHHLVEHEPAPEDRGDRPPRQVVGRRAESARGDDEARSMRRGPERLGETGGVVSHGRLVENLDADLGQALGDPVGVGVPDESLEEFGPDRDDLGARDARHGEVLPRRGRPRAGRRAGRRW